MKAQEVITIIGEIPSNGNNPEPVLYPQIEPFFERGMYVEDFHQTYIQDGKYLITFIFRYYNVAQSKQE